MSTESGGVIAILAAGNDDALHTNESNLNAENDPSSHETPNEKKRNIEKENENIPQITNDIVESCRGSKSLQVPDEDVPLLRTNNLLNNLIANNYKTELITKEDVSSEIVSEDKIGKNESFENTEEAQVTQFGSIGEGEMPDILNGEYSTQGAPNRPKSENVEKDNTDLITKEIHSLENVKEGEMKVKEVIEDKDKREYFTKTANNIIESENESDISLQDHSKITVTQRVQQLSSASKVSLKLWQSRRESDWWGQINASRLHPKCFKQYNLENRNLAIGGYTPGDTTLSKGVRTLITWPGDKQQCCDKKTLASTSQILSSRLNLNVKPGRPVRNIESIHTNICGKPNRTQSQICTCKRYIDHHSRQTHTVHEKTQMTNYSSYRIFETEINEGYTNSMILHERSESELSFPRTNTPVPLHQQYMHPSWRTHDHSYGYHTGRIYPLNASRESLSLHCLSRDTLRNPASAPVLSRPARYPHTLHPLRPRRPNTPVSRSFDDVIQGTSNFLSLTSL